MLFGVYDTKLCRFYEQIVVGTWGLTKQHVEDFTLYTGTLGTAYLLFKSFQVTHNKNDLSLCLEIVKACDSSSIQSRSFHFSPLYMWSAYWLSYEVNFSHFSVFILVLCSGITFCLLFLCKFYSVISKNDSEVMHSTNLHMLQMTPFLFLSYYKEY